MRYFITLLFMQVVLSGLRGANYYVNDNSTAGDIYTTAVGAAGNNGLSPATPKSSIQAIISGYALAGGDIIYIDAGTYNEEVTISGLDGGGAYITFQGAGAASTVIQGLGGANPYAVLMNNSKYIRWQDVKVVETEWAMRIYNNSDYNELVDCEFVGLYGIDILKATSGNSPEYNLIHDCTILSTYVGIRVKSNNVEGGWPASAAVGPSNNQIYDNTIRVESAVVFAALEFQACKDNQAYRNHISSNGNCTEGTLHIAAYSSNILIKNNYITNETAPSGGFLNTVVESDDNSGVDLIHNSIYSVGDCFHFEDVFAQNTLNNFSIHNNIFYTLQGNCIELQDNVSKFKEADNNLYYAPGGNVALTGGTARDLASWQAYDPDAAAFNETNASYEDPQYINPAISNLDLANTSPAIDAVVNDVASVTDDIYQTARPVGPAKDIGAFEHTNPLPVELLFFTAQCTGEGILLKWETAKEEDNDFFTVEKSVNGFDFETVTFVDGKGNTGNTHIYSYADKNGGSYYYRLKQTDFDGKYSYSQTVSVSCEAPKDIVNVSGSDVIVSLNGEDGTPGMINIYSVSGQLIYSSEFTMNGNFSSVNIRLPELAKGAYIIQVVSGSMNYSEKIIFW